MAARAGGRAQKRFTTRSNASSSAGRPMVIGPASSPGARSVALPPPTVDMMTVGMLRWCDRRKRTSLRTRCAASMPTRIRQGRGAVDSFEAYLAGTVCNTGAVAVVRMLDQRHYLEDDAHSARFIQAFAQLSRRVAVTTARHWDFPDRVIKALTERAGHEGQQYSPLGRALRVADRLAMLDMLTDRQLAEGDAVLADADAHGYTPEQMLAIRGQLQRAFATEHSVSA